MRKGGGGRVDKGRLKYASFQIPEAWGAGWTGLKFLYFRSQKLGEQDGQDYFFSSRDIMQVWEAA